jgi:hypothetical protein
MKALRLIFLLLLLANVAFFAWSRYFSREAGASPESHLLQQQLNRDAIRLLTPEQVTALTARSACVEWGGFAADAVAGAEEALGKLLPGVRYGQRTAQEAAAWWVFIPPAASRQAAQQKTAELKRLGVEEFFIVQEDSKFRNAVSLGVFRTQEAARNKLEELRGHGVRTAQVGPRDTSAQLTWFQLRNLPEGAGARLTDLKRGQPGSELRACAGPAPAAAAKSS